MRWSNTKYSMVVVLLVYMLFWSGCRSTGGPYVERHEFEALSLKVDAIETQVNFLVVTTSLPSLASGADPKNLAQHSTLQVTTLPATANEKGTYQKGQSLLKQKKFDQAAVVFSQMLAQNPWGTLAPNARYWLGECHYASGRYAKAAIEFQRCALDYPKSHKAPDSLLKLSYSYDRLGEGHQAMAALDKLLTQYPDSSSAVMIKSGRGRFSR